jgi:hypothetical protein
MADRRVGQIWRFTTGDEQFNGESTYMILSTFVVDTKTDIPCSIQFRVFNLLDKSESVWSEGLMMYDKLVYDIK